MITVGSCVLVSNLQLGAMFIEMWTFGTWGLGLNLKVQPHSVSMPAS